VVQSLYLPVAQQAISDPIFLFFAVNIIINKRKDINKNHFYYWYSTEKTHNEYLKVSQCFLAFLNKK